MSDWFFKERRDQLINWMSIDSWIDSSLASTWQGLQERYNAASSFFARFRLSGWKRVANELGSEALTLGAGGFVLMYALALPAFLEIDENKALNTGKYAVKFLDRNGREIGQRGILHNDAISLEDIPDHMIKATLATEDRRFFEHFGIDPLGTGRALAGERARGRNGAGRLEHHPAGRQEPVPVVGALAPPQDQGAVPVVLAGVALLQARDPEALFRSRLHGRRRLRRGGGGAVLFRQVDQERHAGRVGHARRAVQGADQVCAAHRPAGGAGARQRGAHQYGRGRLHDGRTGAFRAPQSRQSDRDAHGIEPRLVPRLGVRGDPARRRGTRALRADRAHHHRPQPAAGGRAGPDVDHPPARAQPERALRRARVDGAGRRRTRARRRHRLRREPVQPRHARAPPARLLLQALCLRQCRGARPDADNRSCATAT